MPSAERQDRRLKIIACRPIYTGRNQLGHQYTIYEVDAAREDGRLIDAKLRAFQTLPVGRVIEVTIEPFHSEQHGKSYTLHPKESTSPERGEQLNKVLKLLDETKGLLDKLTQRVEVLERAREQASPTPGAPQSW